MPIPIKRTLIFDVSQKNNCKKCLKLKLLHTFKFRYTSTLFLPHSAFSVMLNSFITVVVNDVFVFQFMSFRTIFHKDFK